MSETMSEENASGVWMGSLRRLSLLATLLAAFALAIIFTIAVPLRVGDCGPPDPLLLRYLGAPFFYSTGYGVVSSQEATIWLGPLLANVLLFTAVIFGLNALNNRRASRRGRVRPRWFLWLLIATSASLIAVSSWVIVEAHNVLWTLAGPDVTSATCDIRIDPFADTNAWVTTP